jgi:hypothetical protein
LLNVQRAKFLRYLAVLRYRQLDLANEQFGKEVRSMRI